jgi:hypothetical protein
LEISFHVKGWSYFRNVSEIPPKDVGDYKCHNVLQGTSDHVTRNSIWGKNPRMSLLRCLFSRGNTEEVNDFAFNVMSRNVVQVRPGR